MAKTNPIGVRFDQDLLEKLKKEYGIISPQKALNFLSIYFRDNFEGLVRKKYVEHECVSENYKAKIGSGGGKELGLGHPEKGGEKNLPKKYDYSKMPKGLNYIQQLAWKENARKEQDKI